MADDQLLSDVPSKNLVATMVAMEGLSPAVTSGSIRVLAPSSTNEHDSGHLLKHWLRVPVSTADREAVEIVQRARPSALRSFDQIPMRSKDLLRQAKLVSPSLTGKRVAFVGDMDGTAMLIGLLTAGGGAAPARMIVLDFDDRVLASTLEVAVRYGFGNLIEVRRYNVFDTVPADLIGRWDCFYTNPPYGSYNSGASARLFVTRGCELTKATNGTGCIIIPDDPHRPWTRDAMIATQRFLTTHGWIVREKLNQLHQYHLDDDQDLASALMLVDRVVVAGECLNTMPFAGRQVAFDEIPHFYGRSAPPPYPRHIAADGVPSYEWDWEIGA